MKIFSTVFRDFGKNMVPVITEKNNKKSRFEIIKNGISIFGYLSKKFLFSS